MRRKCGECRGKTHSSSRLYRHNLEITPRKQIGPGRCWSNTSSSVSRRLSLYSPHIGSGDERPLCGHSTSQSPGHFIEFPGCACFSEDFSASTGTALMTLLLLLFLTPLLSAYLQPLLNSNNTAVLYFPPCLFRHISKPRAKAYQVLADILPTKENLAMAWLQHSSNYFDGCGFSGAIRA
jgi:hypothetical protein